MIRCNLAILLAERGYKISNVSRDTGISRTTLTALSQNTGFGIQLETLNTLCMYLNVTPSQFFSVVPFDVDFKCFKLNGDKLVIDVNIDDSRKSFNFSLLADVKATYHDFVNDSLVFVKTMTNLDVTIELYPPDLLNTSDYDRDFFYQNTLLTKYFSSIPISFRTYLNEKLIDCIFLSPRFENEYINNVASLSNIEYSVSWVDAFFTST